VEAVSRHVPRAHQARNLRAIDTTHDRGVWVTRWRDAALLPLQSSPTCFACRSRKPVARAVPLPGDTWSAAPRRGRPRVAVESEVRLDEALPGTQPGTSRRSGPGPRWPRQPRRPRG
jgi:hypothetical protein